MNNIYVWASLLFLIISNIFIVKTHDIAVLCAIALITGIATIFTRTTLTSLRRMRTFLFIGLSIILFQVLLNTSQSLINRLISGIRTTLQLALMSEIVFITLKYISPARIVSALYFLPQKILLLFTMTFAFIPILLSEQRSIQIAQSSRGTGTSFKSRLIAPIALIVPLIHRIFQRAEAISYSLLARGFDEE